MFIGIRRNVTVQLKSGYPNHMPREPMSRNDPSIKDLHLNHDSNSLCTHKHTHGHTLTA